MTSVVITRKLGKVDRALDKAIDGAEMPGAVVLASARRDGELLEHASVRGLAVVRPERIPMSRETIFDLASLTKVMATSTAIAQLTHAGTVGLDDPVAKFIPTFGERDKEAITVRHLLTHSSGLKPWRAFHEDLQARERKKGVTLIGTPEGREWVLNSIFRSAPVHEAGTASVYGDLDMITLGALIEEVTHQSLDEYCDENIFRPFGMKHTGFVPLAQAEAPEAVRRGFAATENCPWRGRILWGEVHDPNASVMGGVAGHAGLFASADDVLKFGQTLLDVWHGRSEVLPRDVLETFATRQNLPANSDWALGWDTPTEGGSSSGQYFSATSIGHLGFTGTSLWIDLEADCVVVMLTNRVHLIAKKSKFGLRAVIHDLIREAFSA